MGNNNLLDWDSVLEDDGKELVTLPEGDYVFEVVEFQRGSFPGSEKMCPCNKATLTLKISTAQGTATVYDDLILHKVMEWKLSAFFRSIGQKKKGQRVIMNWQAVPGAKGRAHIVVNKYTDKNGVERENNKVGRYLDYDDEAMRQADGFVSIEDEKDYELPFN